MKNMSIAIALLFVSSISSAAQPMSQLMKMLNNDIVQNALKGQSVSSMTIKYDKLGRAGFDYTFLVCSASYINKDGSDSSKLIFVVTKIDGTLAFFTPTSEMVHQDFSETESDECKSIRSHSI